MCLLCRRRSQKSDFFRLVYGQDGTLSLDALQRAPGRGAYLCRDLSCIERAGQKKRIPEPLFDQLKEEMERLGSKSG